MSGLTMNIGKSNLAKSVGKIDECSIKRILICRTNHRLGNLLLITPLVQEVASTFPNCKIDLLVQGRVAPIIFENHPHVDRIIQLPKRPFENLYNYLAGVLKLKSRTYDMSINAVKGSSSGKLFTLMSTAKHKIFGQEDFNIPQTTSDFEHIAKYQVYGFRSYLEVCKLKKDVLPIPTLSLRLSEEELALGRKKLESLTETTKQTIAIFTFATADKCLPVKWWQGFYTKLKERYPDYNILEILPVENVSQINFEASTFYSKDIREIAAVIANTKLFIGADCGIMHLASAAEVPVVGLFSRTNQHVYQPYNKDSVALYCKALENEEILTVISQILNSKISA